MGLILCVLTYIVMFRRSEWTGFCLTLSQHGGVRQTVMVTHGLQGILQTQRHLTHMPVIKYLLALVCFYRP